MASVSLVKNVTSDSGVSAKHKDYEEILDMWIEMRDHIAGSRRIKEKGDLYLPMLGDPKSPEDVADYEGYKARAVYYEATKRTLQAMVGAVMLKPMTFTNMPTKYLKDFEQVSMDGVSLATFSRRVISELVSVSRTGVLVERSATGDSQYLVQYKAENIINWRFQREKDKFVLTMVVLREEFNSRVGRFETEVGCRYRVLEMVDGKYQQQIFNEVITGEGDKKKVTYVEEPPVIPTKVGSPLEYIPFVFFTPAGDSPEICEPVLSGIASINRSHYITSADLEHGRHFTALPTAWVAGFSVETRLKVGSQIAWVTENANARAGFLEFTGQGLSSLVTALEEKQEQMATMGARMLRPPRAGVEAAETAKIYQSAESGSLADIAQAASESMTKVIRYWLEWRGMADPSVVSAAFNKDYIDSSISAQDAVALVDIWMKGGISYETLFYNLQQGELLPPDTTVDDERDRIALEGPKGPQLDGGDPPDDGGDEGGDQ